MDKLRILHLEDNLMDAELARAALQEAGLPSEIVRVDSQADFVSALQANAFDLIISDFSLPSFDGKSALAIARQNCPEVPFIFLSGTIGEDAAIESLTSGATDYVLKHKFSRLIPAVRRAHRESQERMLRAQSEEALRRSEEKYRRLFEESKDAIFISLPGGRFSDINSAGVELLGYASREELIEKGRAEELYFEPEKRAEFLSVIEEQGYIRDFELKLRRPDGSVITVLETATAMLDENGRAIAYRGIWRDVTEQRKLEAQFLRAQRLESIGMLASGIAHDLNNILLPILMTAQLLKARPHDDRDARTLDALEQSALRGADLVKQVLSFARGADEQRGPLELRHLIRDVEKIMKETFPKSIRIETESSRDLWSVHGDATQLHQLLMNLCVNARDAMSSGGSLRISVRNVTLEEERKLGNFACKPGNYVVVEVSDTGEGIPEGLLDKVFEAFFTTKEPGKGTGLGLSTAHTIVRNHGGFIDLESAVGQGTTFAIYLPAIGSFAGAGPAAAVSIPTANEELILIVDDEAAIRDICRATLEAHGYRVLTAADGTEGLKMFIRYRDEIRAILTDIHMPNMSGEKMAQTIGRLDPEARIVFMSGVAAPSQTVPAGAGKTARFIQKPFKTDTLLTALGQAVGNEP